MVKRYEFTIYGEPKAKGRPRVMRSGFTFTPKDTVMYENLVKTSFIEQCKPKEFLEGELHCDIDCYFSIPKSKSEKIKDKMRDFKIRPTKKPDLDNLAKAVLDSLNKVAYEDDGQIVTLGIKKFYSDQPRVEVTLSETDLEFKEFVCNLIKEGKDND